MSRPRYRAAVQWPARAGMTAFTSGMHAAFLVAAAVALAGAAIALLTRRGNDTADAHAGI